MDEFKNIARVVGAFFGGLIGGLDGFLYALIVLMVIDYISGVMVAISKKEWSSEVGFKGISKKGYILMFVVVGNIIDTRILGQGSAIRTAVIFFYISNEGGSIVENAVNLGIPVPKKLKDVLIQLKDEESDEIKKEIEVTDVEEKELTTHDK